MNRKGQGLEMNVIVLMILAIITIIIILAIFHKQILKSDKTVGGVSDPLEVKSRCLSTWKGAGYDSYEKCVEDCLEDPNPENDDCFFPK